MTRAQGVQRRYCLAAGGTGGHVLPAYALAGELIARGHLVDMVTDARGRQIPGCPDGVVVHELPAGRMAGGPIGWIRALVNIWRGRSAGLALFRQTGPAAVVGFGGYPSLPTLLAARAAGVPSLVHEQNAVLGRTNRLVARWVDAIAVAYDTVQRIPASCGDKVHVIGNPVRPQIVDLRDEGFPPYSKDGILRILVVGGSLGATVMADVVPAAIQMLPTAVRDQLRLVQQCRADDVDRVRAAYGAMHVPAEVATYLPDFPERLRWAHMVIGRAGASTVAELACAGRPAVFVPYPSAMDDHQTHNVRDLVAAGGAVAMAQDAFTPAALARHLHHVMQRPDALEDAATAAHGCGRPHATRDLADLVEQVGGAPMMDVIRVGAKAQGRPRAGSAVRARTMGQG